MNHPVPIDQTLFTIEGGRWLVYRQPRTDLSELTDLELLQFNSERLLAPFRLVREHFVDVFLLGEFPLRHGDDWDDQPDWVSEESIVHTRHRLEEWLDGPEHPSIPVPPGLIEHVLAEQGNEWTHRDDEWVFSGDSSWPEETTIRLVQRGLRVETILGVSGEPGSIQRSAQQSFLCQAQQAARFARLEWGAETVRVVAQIPGRAVECELRHGLLSVRTVAPLLKKEFEALCHERVAYAFMRSIPRKGGPRQSHFPPG